MIAAELFVDSASTAEARAGMIRVTIPSGEEEVRFAITLHAASELAGVLRRAVVAQHAALVADVVPIPTVKRSAKDRKRLGAASPVIA